jgi:hypothetical protein
MKSLSYKVITFLLLVITINGCKPDEAINPKKFVPIPGYNDDQPAAENTIKFDIEGVTSIYSTTSFVLFEPGDPKAINSETGQISIFGSGADQENDIFSLVCLTSKVGTSDIFFINAGPLTGDDKSGKVTITKLTSNVIQGTFYADVVDDNGKSYHIVGSFNIKM